MAKKKKVDKDDSREERDDSEDLRGGPGKYSRKLASFWKKSVEDVEELQKDWYERGQKVVDRFRDDRKQADVTRARKLASLWANVKIMKPALYGKAPLPVVERRFLQHDPIGRTSSIILERNIKFQIEQGGYHRAVSRAVMDYLLPGRGIVWVRYEPEIGQGDSIPYMSESGVEDELNDLAEEFGDTKREDEDETEKLESTGEQLLSEQTPVDYIAWKEFLMMPVRAETWEQVQAIAKIVPISRKEAEERFGKEIAEKLPRNNMPYRDMDKKGGGNRDVGVFHDLNERSIIIYEIWNKIDRRVYWICPGYEYLCDVKDDPLKLKKFFPVPEPLSSTLTNDSLIPVPDYYEYQDQAIQIDEITQRLALLTKACKVAGTYDAANGPLRRLLQEGFENDLLPVDSWAAFAEKGGVKGGISFLPIDEIQKVIDTLQKTKQLLMQDLDLISGISDVMRGTTDSRETLGGLRLKNNNTGTRLSEKQNDVANFARDVVAIIGEIAAKHFQEKTLLEASNILLDDDMQPEAIMEDLMPSPQAQQQPQQLPPMLGHNGGPPMPPMPQHAPGGTMGTPGGTMGQPGDGLPGQPQLPTGGPTGGNVVQFPGGQPQQPQSPDPMHMLQQLMPQLPMPDPNQIIAERIEKAIALLRKDIPMGYRMEIETDSTIFGDAAQERKDATEFITGVSQFLNQGAQIAQTVPEIMPLLGRMLQWGTRKFRVGRDLESAIDSFVNKMEKKAKDMQKNPQPTPEQMKAQSEQKANELKLQQIQAQNESQKQKTQMEMQAQQANDQRDFQKQQAEDAREAQMAQMEMQNKQQEMAMEMEFKKADHGMKMAELQAKMHQSREQTNMKMQETQQKHAMESQSMQQEHALQLDDHQMQRESMELKAKESAAGHKQKMQQMTLQSKEKDKAHSRQQQKKKATK